MNHKFLMTAALCLTLTAGLAMTGCSRSKTDTTETTNKATTEAASETDAAKSTTFAAETSVAADDAEGTAALDTMIGTVQSTDPDRNYITITVMASYAAGEVPDFDTSNMPGGFQNGRMPGNFQNGEMPEGFDGQVPEDFDADDLPEGFEEGFQNGQYPGNFQNGEMPEGFDGQVPEDFDADDLPEGFEENFQNGQMPGGFQNGQMPGNFPGSGNSGSSGTTLTYMISDSSVLKDADGNTITLSDITENMFVQFSAENGIVAEMVVTVMTVPETPSGN